MFLWAVCDVEYITIWTNGPIIHWTIGHGNLGQIKKGKKRSYMNKKHVSDSVLSGDSNAVFGFDICTSIK